MKSAVVVAVIAAMAAVAGAETIGVWSYAAPAGFQVTKKQTQHEYLRVDGKTFCLVGVYTPRPEGTALAADLKQEWTTVVESVFKATDQTSFAATKTKQGLTRNTASAALANETGTFYGQLVVLRERGTVGSVMVLSNSAKTFTTCVPVVSAVTDSISFAAPAAAEPSTNPLVAQWGGDTALKQNNSDQWMAGYVRWQYDLRSDATYTFRKEIKFEASPKTTFDNYVETGTYAFDGASLTIAPKTTKHVKRTIDGKVMQSDKVALEKVAYAWRQTAGADGETLLILTPSKPTTRDGTPNGGTFAPGGYILSNRKAITWTY